MKKKIYIILFIHLYLKSCKLVVCPLNNIKQNYNKEIESLNKLEENKKPLENYNILGNFVSFYQNKNELLTNKLEHIKVHKRKQNALNGNGSTSYNELNNATLGVENGSDNYSRETYYFKNSNKNILKSIKKTNLNKHFDNNRSNNNFVEHENIKNFKKSEKKKEEKEKSENLNNNKKHEKNENNIYILKTNYNKMFMNDLDFDYVLNNKKYHAVDKNNEDKIVPEHVAKTTYVNNKLTKNNISSKSSFIDEYILNVCKTKRKNHKWHCNLPNVEENDICFPDRFEQICIYILLYYDQQNTDNLKNLILKAIDREVTLLYEKWSDNNKINYNELCHDIRYDYADYGDIIKGLEIKTHTSLLELNKKLTILFKTGTNEAVNRINWWNTHKEEIWNKFISLYRKNNNTHIYACTKYENLEQIPHFERLIQEWFYEYENYKKSLKSVEDICTEKTNIVKDYMCNISDKCKEVCTDYDKWTYKKLHECNTFLKKLNSVKNDSKYVQIEYSHVLFDKLNEICEEINNAVINFKNNIYYNLCECNDDNNFISEKKFVSEDNCKKLQKEYETLIKKKLKNWEVQLNARYFLNDTINNRGHSDVRNNFISKVCKIFNRLDFEKIFDINYTTYLSICNCFS
ncbi:duffy binding protein, putative [Hepatocystis sp. ex Piliocolobus tephrosceles]|nr:duffy binding protein, putative [Hepatocystis sp. ex Piliocolobus tephrosceles]